MLDQRWSASWSAKNSAPEPQKSAGLNSCRTATSLAALPHLPHRSILSKCWSCVQSEGSCTSAGARSIAYARKTWSTDSLAARAMGASHSTICTCRHQCDCFQSSRLSALHQQALEDLIDANRRQHELRPEGRAPRRRIAIRAVRQVPDRLEDSKTYNPIRLAFRVRIGPAKEPASFRQRPHRYQLNPVAVLDRLDVLPWVDSQRLTNPRGMTTSNLGESVTVSYALLLDHSWAEPQAAEQIRRSDVRPVRRRLAADDYGKR